MASFNLYQIPGFNYSGAIPDFSTLPGAQTLSAEQELFLYAAAFGKFNILLTGNAGSGKSHSLQLLHRIYRANGLVVQFCGTTGIAATQLPVGGCTLHSWLRMGLAEGNPRDLAVTASRKKEVKHLFHSTDCLVIDEVSMLTSRMLELVHLIGQKVRGNDKPFGGIQVILVGDFAQIKPIKKQELGVRSKDGKNGLPEGGGKFTYTNRLQAPMSEEDRLWLHNLEQTDYCFEHPEFNQLIDVIIPLKTVFRQSDEHFVQLLNRIRFGLQTSDDIDLLRSLNQKTQMKQELEKQSGLTITLSEQEQANNEHPQNVAIHLPTKMSSGLGTRQVYLYAINKKVDEKNVEEVKKISTKLNTKTYYYKSKVRKANPFNRNVFESWLENQKQNCMAKPQLELCIGCQVMLVVNKSVEDGLVNGSLGVVVGFSKFGNKNPIVRFPLPKDSNGSKTSNHTNDNDNNANVSNKGNAELSDQIIKSEVSEEESREMDKLPFAKTVSSLDNMIKMAKEYQDVEIGPHTYKLEDETELKQLEEQQNHQEDNDDGDRNRAKRMKFSGKKGNGRDKESSNPEDDIAHITYEQIPLRVAYGISIHKSQGQTIPNLVIDAGDIWDHGQFYVALSRATSLDSLQLSGFFPSCIRTHPKVVQFYDQIHQDTQKWMNVFQQQLTDSSSSSDWSSGDGEMMSTSSKSRAQASCFVVRELRRQKEKNSGQNSLLASWFHKDTAVPM